jgi:gliding motility-associated-like protein
VGSTPGLTFTYWTDPGATIPCLSPQKAAAGTYYIKGTNSSGYFSIKPVIVTIDQLPVPKAGLDQTLDYQFNTILDATLGPSETGIWSLVSGTCIFYDTANPQTPVSELSLGDNVLVWTVSNGVCPAVSDTVKIVAHNLTNPTLITPNMDGRNDIFIIRGLSTLGKSELVIFDRRGFRVYNNPDYDNRWAGVDFNNNPLPDDTYFFVLKPQNGKPLKGYVVIRR